MGPLDPDIVGAILGIPGAVLALALILRFKLKKKELEMGGGDPKLGPVMDELRDDLNDTRAQLADMQEVPPCENPGGSRTGEAVDAGISC